MKRSPFNIKPIICAPSEAAIIIGKAIREYLKNETADEVVKRYDNFKKKVRGEHK